MYVSIISIIIILICGIISYNIYNYWKKKSEEEIQHYKYEEYKKEKEVVARRIEEELSASYSQLKNLKEKIDSLNEEIESKKDFNTSLLKIREEELSRLMEEKELKEKDRIQREVEDWEQSAQEAATYNASLLINRYREIIAEQKKERDEILDELEEFRRKREVVNQEILRARALEEQQDFYRIQLDEASKQDITFLLSIIDRFNNKEVIYKLIWSEYIQKPFKSMINRVLSGRDPKNVIYMIKNMDINEIYIGKTKAEVSKRWTEHIKTSLNIGTISRTNIHKALFNNWDKFSFTVLEEVPSDANLGERERYYIKFYESDIFGYNIKSGG